jgi:copper chaperone CopZ
LERQNRRSRSLSAAALPLAPVKSVRTSYQKRAVEVEFDEKRVTGAKIKEAFEAVGYTVG